MNKIIVGCVIGLTAAATMSGAAQADAPECNWGQLTASSIAELDFDQGGHSSDPSGDGHGPGTADEPRVGLANVGERGDLEFTCQIIASLLG
jgi:hypothetical protein